MVEELETAFLDGVVDCGFGKRESVLKTGSEGLDKMFPMARGPFFW